ncbi:MAG: hypothetical protein ACI828_000697 [Flavobacteriales bacterium]|jgi:hypothetical protein
MQYIKVIKSWCTSGMVGINPPIIISVAICYWGGPDYSDAHINITTCATKSWPRNGVNGFILSLKRYNTVNSYFVMPSD